MGESGVGAYGWLTTLIPGILPTDLGGGGIGTPITLTADGAAAFPALSAAAVANAIPWHGYFGGNLGSLKVLATADYQGTRNVIIGGGEKTVISVPEPGILGLLGFGLLGLGFFRKRRSR
jgi:hypothetical protein